MVLCNAEFGPAGINPPLACGYIMFETSQYDFPNTPYKSYELNHYVWAYLLCPMLGGVLGGILHILHAKCVEKKGTVDSNEATDDAKNALLE